MASPSSCGRIQSTPEKCLLRIGHPLWEIRVIGICTGFHNDSLRIMSLTRFILSNTVCSNMTAASLLQCKMVQQCTRVHKYQTPFLKQSLLGIALAAIYLTLTHWMLLDGVLPMPLLLSVPKPYDEWHGQHYQ